MKDYRYKKDCCQDTDPCGKPKNDCGCKIEVPAECVLIDTSCLEDLQLPPGSNVEDVLCSIYTYIKETEYYLPNKVKRVEFSGDSVQTSGINQRYYIIQDDVVTVDKVHYEGVLLPESMWSFTYPNRLDIKLETIANILIEGDDYFIIEYQTIP